MINHKAISSRLQDDAGWLNSLREQMQTTEDWYRKDSVFPGYGALAGDLAQDIYIKGKGSLTKHCHK